MEVRQLKYGGQIGSIKRPCRSYTEVAVTQVKLDIIISVRNKKGGKHIRGQANQKCG